MRSEIVEKRLASIPALSRKGKRINGLFRLLACPNIWEQAYEDIASNQGALTPGVNPNNTLNGFSLERVERIITGVMDGTYRFAPARRLYIPKPDGRKRPLGIPTADDKLVQAAVKILLEYVYEPIFSDRSHGFRKGRSCHTALEQIKYGWSGVKWLVEVDVSSFFDNVDHDILLNLLRRRIDDERLICLIGRMLKAGYMEDWTFNKTFSGTPQGGVISPILANIYLHELDEHMKAMKAEFDKGTKRRNSSAYIVFRDRIARRRKKIKALEESGNQHEIPPILAEIREFEQMRRDVPASDWFDPGFRRLIYCRYADDFLVGVIGSKADAQVVMEAVQKFLNVTLKLETSPQKTGIRKADDGVTFLGYSVRTYNHQRLHRYRWHGQKTVIAKMSSDRLQLHAPVDKLIGFVERNRLGSYHMNRGMMRPEMIHDSDIQIITRYNSMMRGIAEYYKFGTSWRHEIGRLYNVWWRSLINTLARKHKCSAAKICRKLQHRDGYGLWYQGQTSKRFMAVFALKHVSNEVVRRTIVDYVPRDFTSVRSDVLDRLRAKTCEACRADGVPVEVHHARRLKDMKDRGLDVRIRAARTRKRIVLCVPCHHAHHEGRLTARLHALDAGVGAG